MRPETRMARRQRKVVVVGVARRCANGAPSGHLRIFTVVSARRSRTDIHQINLCTPARATPGAGHPRGTRARGGVRGWLSDDDGVCTRARVHPAALHGESRCADAGDKHDLSVDLDVLASEVRVLPRVRLSGEGDGRAVGFHVADEVCQVGRVQDTTGKLFGEIDSLHIFRKGRVRGVLHNEPEPGARLLGERTQPIKPQRRYISIHMIRHRGTRAGRRFNACGRHDKHRLLLVGGNGCAGFDSEHERACVLRPRRLFKHCVRGTAGYKRGRSPGPRLDI
mmetsp:Transcript_19986/g.46040  ORF Transcript_19986/g.46040 Transcript_19986/m.46040 type:complete len:280 (-) Transcript_19986:167-1006(-)